MPASPISYALPVRENLDSDEDWSRVSDRKMKKRLQNRVAQREYRRRTRERIEELTAELNEFRRQAHEPRDGGINEGQDRDESRGSVSPRETREQSAQQQQKQLPPPQPQQVVEYPLHQHQPTPQAPSLQHTESDSLPQLSEQQQQQSHQQPPQTQQNALAAVGLANISTTTGPSTTISPYLLQSSSSSSSPSSVIPASGLQQREGISDQAVPRTLSHEAPNMARPTLPLDQCQRSRGLHAADGAYDEQEDMLFLPIDMDTVGDGGGSGVCGDNGGKEANANGAFSMSEGISTVISNQTPSTGPHSQGEAQSAPDILMHGPDHLTSSNTRRSSEDVDHANVWHSLPGADASLEQRFDFLFNWVQHAGFDSLDHLFEMWYTGNFNDSPSLRQEQRLSRRRGLTTLLAKLRASTHWSKWERWGYQEETLQGAESILRAEFGDHIAALEARSERDKLDSTKALKRCLQDELPHLRTLLMAITVDSGKTGRRVNRKAIDAATMVLSVAGRVSDADLLLILQDIIQNGTRTG